MVSCSWREDMPPRLRGTALFIVCLTAGLFGVKGKKDDHVIGIDLGTTYSCVGVYRVAFTEDGEQLVGEAAKNQVGNNPTNTLYDVKRIIGRAFDDPDAQKDIKSFPFNVKERGGKPVISIEYQGKSKTLMPEEVSAMILSEMKKVAEDFLGTKVSKAVVTVPAYFNDAQRQATKNAGKIAGLDILRIINEPTAAAIAYGLDKGGTMKNILVFDLGGGTFDVSLLTVNNGVFEVLATNGDTHLGGEDFDKRLVAYIAKQFEAKTGVALSKSDKSAIARLRRECENAKRMLSTQMQVTVEVEDIKGGKDLREKLTRAKFEELNMDLFKKTLIPVQNVLKDAGMGKKQVHEVILVGGSTRIPKVRQLLKDFFNGKEPSAEVNPDEAVAFGATVQAGILTGQDFALMAGGSGFKDLVLIDVTPLTLGIETTGGIMTPVIDRNQAIPARKSKVFTTEVDNQANVYIQVYQGERQFVKDNSRLGGFTLGNIPPAPRGVPQIDVAFHIDANGILFVTAQDLGTKKKESITISNSMGRLSEDEIERMIRDAKKFADQDRKAKVRMEARQGLLGLMRSIEAAMKDEVGRAMDESDKAEVREAITNTQKWLKSKEGKKADADDLEERKANIERLWKPLVTRAYQEGGGGGGGGGGGDGGDEDGSGDKDRGGKSNQEDSGPDEL